MTPLLSFAGTCVLLFSCLAIGIGTAPAQATTIYDFTATYNPGSPSVASDFTLQYDDLNGNGRFSIDELVANSFSGVTYPGIGFFETLTAVPVYNSINSPLTESGGNDFWYFTYLPLPATIGTPNTYWTYSQTASVVPLPPAALLMGSGLFGLGLRRFRKS